MIFPNKKGNNLMFEQRDLFQIPFHWTTLCAIFYNSYSKIEVVHTSGKNHTLHLWGGETEELLRLIIEAQLQLRMSNPEVLP